MQLQFNLANKVKWINVHGMPCSNCLHSMTDIINSPSGQQSFHTITKHTYFIDKHIPINYIWDAFNKNRLFYYVFYNESVT